MSHTTMTAVQKAHSRGVFTSEPLQTTPLPPPHKRSLPASVAQALKPIYERLGDPQLLRCLAGKTQNSNESFHSVLWSLCPKERWGNLRTVDTALAIAVQRFNKGASALQDVMLELVTGSTVEDFALKEDTARVRKATKKSSDKEKEKRKKMDTVGRREQQKRREREGEVYGPEQF
ncbi:hypothetical protein ACOMHN_028821 [Nucella lapillus]